MKIRIGVLSDTHLRRVSRDLREVCDRLLSDVDMVLHAGDFVSPEIIEFLSSDNFHGVHGNMDPTDIKRRLPAKKVVELDPYRIGLIHGWGPSEGLEERICSEFQHVDAIVYGHSHRAANHLKDGVLLFNPGTATGFTYAGVHSIGILELGDRVHGEVIDIS